MKCAIFDLDGVIVDTSKYHYLAWKKIADDLGFAFTEAHNEGLKGISRMESLDVLLGVGGITLPQAQKERLASEKNEIYLQYVMKITKDNLLEGVCDCLTQLRRSGCKIALGSASKNAKTVLHLLEIENLFDVVVDGTDTSKTKPDPEVFVLAAQRAGVLPADCVVFEDSVAGIEAALAGGMGVVGIGDAANLPQAKLVVSSLGEYLRKFG